MAARPGCSAFQSFGCILLSRVLRGLRQVAATGNVAALDPPADMVARATFWAIQALFYTAITTTWPAGILPDRDGQREALVRTLLRDLVHYVPQQPGMPDDLHDQGMHFLAAQHGFAALHAEVPHTLALC